MGTRFLSLWAALVLLVLSSGAWAQSSHAAPTQSKGIDPAVLAKAKAGDAVAEFLVGLVYRIGEDVPQDNALGAEVQRGFRRQQSKGKWARNKCLGGFMKRRRT
jgi:hypothetical protein